MRIGLPENRVRIQRSYSSFSAMGASNRALPHERTRSRSVAEVVELEGHAEVALLQRGDDALEVVSLLADDPQLVALGLGLDALEAQALDELVELTGLVRGDPGHDGGVLADGATRRLLDHA